MKPSTPLRVARRIRQNTWAEQRRARGLCRFCPNRVDRFTACLPCRRRRRGQPWKSLALLFVLLAGAWSTHANELPEAPIAKPAAVEPKPAVSLHPFYDRQAKLEVGVELGAAAFDSAQTCHNLTNGGREYWLPTQSCVGATAILSAQVAGVELGAYLLHRAHHDKLAHVVRWFAIAESTRGIVYSKQHGAW